MKAIIIICFHDCIQGAFWGIVCGIAMGVTRMVLDIAYPAPTCGEPETRPPVIYKVHFLYYNVMVAVVSFVVTVVVSLMTDPPPPEMVSTNCDLGTSIQYRLCLKTHRE